VLSTLVLIATVIATVTAMLSAPAMVAPVLLTGQDVATAFVLVALYCSSKKFIGASFQKAGGG
jgi:hypothetical protein